MIGFTSRQERSTVMGDQNLYWTIIRNPGFLSPLDHAIQSADVLRLLKTQGFLQALETEQDSVLAFLTTRHSIQMILNTMLQDIQPPLKPFAKLSEPRFNSRYTEDDICAIDSLLQTARFGTKFYGVLLRSEELPKFFNRWVESDMYLIPRQSERFASFIKHIVWHESRRMQFIEVLSSALSKPQWDSFLRCTCNHHVVDSLTAIFQVCMPLGDTSTDKILTARAYAVIGPHFQLNDILICEIDRCIERGSIGYLESMRFESLCSFISEMILYNHPLLQSSFYSCTCTLAQFLFQGSLVITESNEYVHATLNAIGTTVVSAMSFLMRSTHSYLRKPEVIAEVQSLLYQYGNPQELYALKRTNRTPQLNDKKFHAPEYQAATSSFSVNSTIMDSSDLERCLRSSVEPSKKVSRLTSPLVRRLQNKAHSGADSRENSASLCPTLVRLQPAVLNQLQAMIPHASVLSMLWELFSDKNEQLVEYCYANYTKYILHFYEDDEDHMGQIHQSLESAFSSSEKSTSDYEPKPSYHLVDCTYEKSESSRPTTAAYHPAIGRPSTSISKASSAVSDVGQHFADANVAAIHTAEPTIDHKDHFYLCSSPPISHTRSLSYAGKGKFKSSRRPGIDSFSLSNNSFTNIYKLSNQYDQSSFDQVFPSDEDSNWRQRSATRSKPIKPKKLLSRYNPFIKAHRTDYLRGLQEELNQTCQLFLNKTPEPLQLSLIIRLTYLTRILSLVADVRCLQYFTSLDKEPVSAFNNSIRQPDESIGYMANYSAELPPTAECGCGGPSEVSLRDLFVFYDSYQMPYSSLELSAQLLKIKHLFPLIDCLGPIYRNSHILNLLGNRFRHCALDLSTFYPELLGILFPLAVERYDSFTAAIAMSSSPELRCSTFCTHLLSSVRAMLRKAAGITDEDLYKSRFVQLQTFANTLNIAPEPTTDFPITPVAPTKHLRGFTDSQLGRGAKRASGEVRSTVQSTLQVDRKPSRSILSMCGRSDKYQNSSIDFTQSELISVSSPTQQHCMGKREMALPSNNVEDSSFSFTTNSIAEWEDTKSPSLSSRKKKSMKFGLSLDLPSDPNPPREVVVPWTVKELFDIIRDSKVSTDAIDRRCLDICMKRKDIQLLNKLYLNTACKQRNFADDHSSFMSVMLSHNHPGSVENEQQNIFTESFILGVREKRQKNREPKGQLLAAMQQIKDQKEADFNTLLSDSVIRIGSNSTDKPQKLSVTGSTLRLVVQEKSNEDPTACVRRPTYNDDSDYLSMFKDICDEQA
ncbi:Hypothetical protein GLP15_5033 [Giardia lamblia P15]|uniref:Uncharacterized protein n=1 Tax=Giardia intestinalis (strain P15) TaxID=658858 RepID=E1EWM6_GIAIA|nr:Hypothetical protein GLP15_5033 [Giardia lamblia P15]